MPARQGLRALKAWRYVGIYGPDLMLCLGAVRVGPARQAFWALWDRQASLLYERTVRGRGTVRLEPGRARVADGRVELDIELAEIPGIEAICPSGESYAWTRKQGGVRARGAVAVDGRLRALDAYAVIDDSAGYHERSLRWQWSAGVGTARDGRAVAWNLVSGINDPPRESERTVWVDGDAAEVGPNAFARDLSWVAFAEGGELHFRAEAERVRRENTLLVRSSYRQPFGTFAGVLPGGIVLAHGFGVMEEHDVRW
ncbi:MAG TPA: DUF2804 family protein [Solirubrobacteraceae bacterium]|jgi:hypothetical protein|nr:DUF2804 family protein [Solirubrobacteraceae bacterium]